MNKQEIKKKYGKTRIQEMFHFLDKLNRYYSFPYSDENLYDFVVDLELYLKRDLFEALRILEDRDSTYPLKFNEIKGACRDAKAIRVRIENMSIHPKESEKPCPMPDKIKEFVNRVLSTEGTR